MEILKRQIIAFILMISIICMSVFYFTYQKDEVLIVYFSPGENSKVDIASSCSVTQINDKNIGTIRYLTDKINTFVKGDVFPIKTSEKYSGNINKVVEKAKNEQEKNVYPVISNKIDNLDKYNIIFVGYPIWWSDMPQVMYSFFDEYDFSEKVIIPYSTSKSGRGAQIESKIKELEPNATVKPSLNILSNHVKDSDDAIQKWLKKIEF